MGKSGRRVGTDSERRGDVFYRRRRFDQRGRRKRGTSTKR